jgi:serine/threonine-protein kinase
VHVRPLDQGTAQVLAGAEGARQLCFSPDGRWIAYLIGNVIWKVPVSGGTPVLVGPTDAAPVGLTWTPAGAILTGTSSGLLAVPANGGAPRLAAALDSAAGELYFNQPRALPDGETVLFSIQSAGGLTGVRLGAASLSTGVVTRFGVNALDPLALVDGTLVYVMPSGALMAVPLDLRRGRATGSPVTLGPTVATTIAGASQAALSPSGTLIYQAPNVEAMLGWVDARGRFQALLPDVQAYAYPRLSPDGRRIAMAVGSGGRSDVWLYDLSSATPTRLTSAGTLNDRPEWTPDGQRVLYRTDRQARVGIWWQAANLSGLAAPLLASDAHDYYEGVVSPDGRWIAFQVDDAGASQADVMYRALQGDTVPRPVAATGFVEAQPRLSPDGRWIAFVTDASGGDQVVVQPFPGPGGRVQVSVAGGSEPVWSRDGRRLFYRAGRHLIAASVATTPAFAVTRRTALFADTYVFTQAPHANYDVSLDGSRFLMLKSAAGAQLTVVYGWLSELRSRFRNLGGS